MVGRTAGWQEKIQLEMKDLGRYNTEFNTDMPIFGDKNYKEEDPARDEEEIDEEITYHIKRFQRQFADLNYKMKEWYEKDKYHLSPRQFYNNAGNYVTEIKEFLNRMNDEIDQALVSVEHKAQINS